VVTISGSDQDKVYDARDHLLNMEEEYIQDVTENEYMQQYVRKDDSEKKSKQNKQSNGFVVKGAPWEAPDTQVCLGFLVRPLLISSPSELEFNRISTSQSTVDFPTFGNGIENNSEVAAAPVAPAPKPLSSAWGARKQF
jgi:hypothetical protein